MSEFLSSAPLSFYPAALRQRLGLTEEEMTALLTGDLLTSLTRQALLSSLLQTSPIDWLRTLLSTPPLAGKFLPDIAPETVSAFLSGSPLPEPKLCSLFTSAMTRLRDPEADSAPSSEEMLAADRDVFLEKTGLPLSVLSRIAAAQPASDLSPELSYRTVAALLANLFHEILKTSPGVLFLRGFCVILKVEILRKVCDPYGIGYQMPSCRLYPQKRRTPPDSHHSEHYLQI